MRFVAALVASIVLFSCSSHPILAPDDTARAFAYQQRAADLRLRTSWDLSGKLSIDDGEDGGSGKLSWEVSDELSIMSFRGALGRGAWKLDSGPGFAILSKADGQISRANSVSELVETEVGWHIPINSLKWWVLGIAAPGETGLTKLDSGGLLQELHQNGWRITFDRYRIFGKENLPVRIEAVNGPYRIKMAVSRWTFSSSNSTDE
ncbi:MAG: outer membrane lipoprotein LolB [Rhodothermales bacterium]|jgi:outer membrane lipoprotein LolB